MGVSFDNMEATIKSELVEILTEVESLKARLELAIARLEVLVALILRIFLCKFCISVPNFVIIFFRNVRSKRSSHG